RFDINPHTLHAVALEGGETPLHIVCFAGHLTFAATVIKLRQEFCKELNQDGFSPLHIAAACGHVDIVKELLKLTLSKIDVVRELLASSLDSVECTTAQGETSLHLAVMNNQFEALKVLMQHLKQVNKEDLLNCKDFHGNNSLHLAVARKQYEGSTPLDILLMFQSEAGDREIEELLVQAGALKAGNLQSPAYTQEQTAYHSDTRSENPPSPAMKLINYFKYNNLQDSPNKVRNTLLVIIILITSATYQPALSPPGGAWQDDFTPSIMEMISLSEVLQLPTL
ncbi:ankyrin repeat-containing protein BDA1-like protein, partial [Tanacetum coccineum]